MVYTPDVNMSPNGHIAKFNYEVLLQSWIERNAYASFEQHYAMIDTCYTLNVPVD